jgi:Tfp pilus assembly PilM family ATPase
MTTRRFYTRAEMRRLSELLLAGAEHALSGVPDAVAARLRALGPDADLAQVRAVLADEIGRGLAELDRLAPLAALGAPLDH